MLAAMVLGAVLLQRGDDNQLYPIAYVSRTLTLSEQKEALTSVWVIETFSKYLIGLESFDL